MSAQRKQVAELHPNSVEYREHTITLVHRPKINDWQYTVKHTRTIELTQAFPRYDTALSHAKSDIDILLDGGKKS